MNEVELGQILYPALAGPFISILVGLGSGLSWPSWIKAVMNLGFSALSGVLLSLAASVGDPQVEVLVLSGLITWVTSIAIHFGFWKPSGATEVVQRTGVQ